MELDELKSIWQNLEIKLQRENSIGMALLRHQKLESTRRRLRWLFVGQTAQLFYGLGFILLAGLSWSLKPRALPVIIATIIVHAYGIGCMVAGGVVLAAAGRIDYAGSVIDVQSKLMRVRRAYVVSGMVAGLTWWFLWIPLLMVIAGLLHINLYRHAPSVIWIGTAIGVAGLAAMLAVYRYSRRVPQSRLRRVVDDAVFGRSLQKAQAQLDEILQFEQEMP
jgi:hypothetical protein